MDKYKGFVVDCDGTLVDISLVLSQPVKEAITKLVNKGYIFSIATGRPYWGIVKKFCQELNLTSPQITSGGSEIVDPKTEKVLWTQYFPESEAEKLINYFLENNYEFSVESEGKVFTPTNNARVNYGPGIPMGKFDNLDYGKIIKMVLFNVAEIGDPEKLGQDLGDQYKDLHFIRARLATEGAPFVLDITSNKATKHLAVLELSKILNLDPELMIGVGDGYNDYPLLSVCGYKVAMDNAPKELKEIADLVVPDVAHDGLVTLIDKLV